MSAWIIRGNALGKALIDEGLVPPNCSLVEVRMPADGAATLVFTTFVSLDDLPKIARAMLRAAEGEAPKT